MKIRAAAMAGLLALSCAASACGGDDDAADGGRPRGSAADETTTGSVDDSPPTSAAPETESSAAASTEEGEGTAPALVEIVDFAFEPPTVTVSAGTEVTFENLDSTAHTATADDGTFDTGNIAAADAVSITVESTGEVAFHCEIHPSMTGMVIVTEG